MRINTVWYVLNGVTGDSRFLASLLVSALVEVVVLLDFEALFDSFVDFSGILTTIECIFDLFCSASFVSAFIAVDCAVGLFELNSFACDLLRDRCRDLVFLLDLDFLCLFLLLRSIGDGLRFESLRLDDSRWIDFSLMLQLIISSLPCWSTPWRFTVLWLCHPGIFCWILIDDCKSSVYFLPNRNSHSVHKFSLILSGCTEVRVEYFWKNSQLYYRNRICAFRIY